MPTCVKGGAPDGGEAMSGPPESPWQESEPPFNMPAHTCVSGSNAQVSPSANDEDAQVQKNGDRTSRLTLRSTGDSWSCTPTVESVEYGTVSP